MNEVTTREDIESFDGQRVKLTGIYRQYELRKGPSPEGQKKYFRGHVYLELEDGEGVILLPVWDRTCIRNRKEIKRFQGKKVSLIGVIHAEAPNHPGPMPVQNLMVPCLTYLEGLDFVTESNAKLDLGKK